VARTEEANMEAPSALLRFIAKASLNAIGFGMAGDAAVEVRPGVCRDVWGWWSKDRSDEQRRAEVEALAKTPTSDLKPVIKQTAAEAAAGKPREVELALESFLTLMPSTLRRSLRRRSLMRSGSGQRSR
jgi:hypothetical protein